MRKLILVIGPAGAGKTTLAKALAARRRAGFFDMDTLLRPAAEAIMTLLGLDPSDRDSAAYKEHCRDLGYRIAMDAALDNIALGNDAIVVGPFTQELSNPTWIEQELLRIGASVRDVDVKVIYVYLADEGDYRRRIEARGSELDVWKLQHWEQFRGSLLKREIAWPLGPQQVLYFDNREPFSEQTLERLERFAYGEA